MIARFARPAAPWYYLLPLFRCFLQVPRQFLVSSSSVLRQFFASCDHLSHLPGLPSSLVRQLFVSCPHVSCAHLSCSSVTRQHQLFDSPTRWYTRLTRSDGWGVGWREVICLVEEAFHELPVEIVSLRFVICFFVFSQIHRNSAAPHYKNQFHKYLHVLQHHVPYFFP